ncbi:DUF2264 domain-containing protein [Phytomonospora endophytica]|uniref:DUF2264 domain-containing protein n=1 Tax=Phytomonospora endophytica TaxID=714109 RepID=A0A841FB25_9ACTN|nr:DUF2264 domain-containing protein [Phytomonospora endophytica]MBB6033456.1 hypothetical protein [Phytomonospora endophytica]
MLQLPAEDRVHSPRTGWSRAHWEAVADHWLGTLREYSSPRHALPVLPGRVTDSGVRREALETFGRSFLMAAPRIAGARGRDPLGLADWYAEGLDAGTDPDSPEAWPRGATGRRPLLGITNPIVEAANLAFGLHLTREWVWDRLDRPVQKRVAAWLLHHARTEVFNNNWQLFPSMAEAFLASVGEDTRGCTGPRNVARVESWHLGGGWFTDGPEHAVDHYNAFVIHPYLWAWHRMRGDLDPAASARYLERLSAFTDSYSRLFAPDGSALHFGRSLTYRTAVLAPFWAAEISGVSSLRPGATRRLASGVLANFTRHGVGVDGPLTIGWHGEHLPSSQAYSGFGSPYLAGIGFLGLALPAEHPVWADAEEPQPTDETDARTVLPQAGLIASATASDGIVRLVNHGSDHCGLPVGAGADPDDPHYAKFAYSSHTAPGTGASWEEGADGHVALIAPDGRSSRRGPLRGWFTEGPVAASAHVPQRDGKAWPGTSVVTASIVDGPFELRCHLVTGPADHALREGGHAVSGTGPDAGTETTAAWAASGGLVAGVVGVHGWDRAETLDYADGTAIGPRATVPILRAERSAASSVHVALHVLTRGEPDVTAWREAVSVEVDGTVVTAVWRSGATARVDLATFVPWDGHPG